MDKCREYKKTMHARRGDDREPTCLFVNYIIVCLIIFNGRIKHAYCFLESFVEPRKLSFNVEMVRCFIFFFDISNTQSPILRSLNNAALFDSYLCL